MPEGFYKLGRLKEDTMLSLASRAAVSVNTSVFITPFHLSALNERLIL